MNFFVDKNMKQKSTNERYICDEEAINCFQILISKKTIVTEMRKHEHQHRLPHVRWCKSFSGW